MPELKLRPTKQPLDRWREVADGRPLAPFLVQLVDEALERRELEPQVDAPADGLAGLQAIIDSIRSSV